MFHIRHQLLHQTDEAKIPSTTILYNESKHNILALVAKAI